MKQREQVTGRIEVSDCGVFRYALWRKWDPSLPDVMFIGLNPATADATRNDNTISRCMSYARQWDFGGIAVVNLFAFRSTWPEHLKQASDPVGPDNDLWLTTLGRKHTCKVAIWGNHGLYLQRAEKVTAMIDDLQCLRRTRLGQPHHTRGLPDGLIPSSYIN